MKVRAGMPRLKAMAHTDGKNWQNISFPISQTRLGFVHALNESKAMLGVLTCSISRLLERLGHIKWQWGKSAKSI